MTGILNEGLKKCPDIAIRRNAVVFPRYPVADPWEATNENPLSFQRVIACEALCSWPNATLRQNLIELASAVS